MELEYIIGAAAAFLTSLSSLGLMKFFETPNELMDKERFNNMRTFQRPSQVSRSSSIRSSRRKNRNRI